MQTRDKCDGCGRAFKEKDEVCEVLFDGSDEVKASFCVECTRGDNPPLKRFLLERHNDAQP